MLINFFFFKVHKAHFQEVKQDGTAPAVVSDKVSFTETVFDYLDLYDS